MNNPKYKDRLGDRVFKQGDVTTTMIECENGETSLQTDEKSFACITCVKGQGEIDGQIIQTGDSYFIPANYGVFTLKGDIEIIETKD